MSNIVMLLAMTAAYLTVRDRDPISDRIAGYLILICVVAVLGAVPR